MPVFPKQYQQIKGHSSLPENSTTPFFFLPEQYTKGLHIDQLFRLFILDTLHILKFGSHLSDGYFLSLDTLSATGHHLDFATKQLKKFGLSSLISGLETPLDLAFKFDLQNFFVKYFSEGTFFEDRFITYWSNISQSPISGDFTEIQNNKKRRYTIKYFVSTKNNSLNVITDSPETIFGDVAIAIHPQHKKAKVLKGQQAIIPIINKTIPIIIDERADFTRYGGVYRVTPGHDKIGLEIAKDHNLPIDTYAIDEHGLFTEHAGLFSKKPVKDFFSNIIQNLGDIGNLIETEEIISPIPFCKQTGEQLIPRCRKGLYVKLPSEILSEFLDQEQLHSFGGIGDLQSAYWLASSSQKTGVPVPLWITEQGIQALDSHWFLEAYKKSKEKSGSALGLFIFFMISSGLLEHTFSAETLVSLIFDFFASQELEHLFEKIAETHPETQKEFEGLLKVIHELSQEKSLEKAIEKVFDLLDGAYYLSKESHGNYRFSFESLDKRLSGISPYEQTISPDFSTILLLIKKLEAVQQKITFSVSQDFLKTAIKDICFASYVLKKPIVEKFLILPLLKKEKESGGYPLADLQLTKTYHGDCVRVGLLSLTDSKDAYTPTLFEDWDLAIAKFWNACRYIKTSFFAEETSLPFAANQKYIEKNISTFSAFDSWIISKLVHLIEEYQQVSSAEDLGKFLHSAFHFVQQDFSSKYLELIKTAASDHSQQVSLCVVATLTTLLQSYLPILTSELSRLFGFGSTHTIAHLLGSFESIQKNYSISLFMELIDKFSEIKCSLGFKKHDKVSIFIRSNPDFIKFVKTNESLLSKTLHAEEVIYLVHHEEIPCGYQKEDIIDISVGLKAMPKGGISGIQLLQKQLQKKEEYLQHLKSLVQQLSSNGADMDVIQSKKKEIATIKEEIDQISFEISTCKSK